MRAWRDAGRAPVSQWGMRMRALAWLGVGAAITALAWSEARRPLRRRTQRVVGRVVRNLAVAATGVAGSLAAEALVVEHLGRWAERRRVGVLRRMPLPSGVRAVAGFLALDYTLYLWHVLNHRAQWLWRFHLVHHVDRDLDASTGLRFHFGELALTALLRTAQVVLLGVDRRTLSIWQRLLVLSVLFHHSNVRLPLGLERRLNRIIVTPRMHGIHHSEIREETDSNFSSMLSCWDALHRTLRLNVPQEVITIGVPGYRDSRELTLGPILLLPFMPQRPSWEPTAGLPVRAAPGLPASGLAG
jgi:sterol desaturase/sphingolipid hydroxylase (fatty acid hydroxylase superfamily)